MAPEQWPNSELQCCQTTVDFDLTENIFLALEYVFKAHTVLSSKKDQNDMDLDIESNMLEELVNYRN